MGFRFSGRFHPKNADELVVASSEDASLSTIESILFVLWDVMGHIYAQLLRSFLFIGPRLGPELARHREAKFELFVGAESRVQFAQCLFILDA